MRHLIRWTNNQDSLWGLSKLQQEMTPSFMPACDMEETDAHYLVSFDVPGVSKDDLKIELVDGMLTVTGERNFQRDQTNASQHLLERSYGQFKRSFSLPAQIDAEKVEANYQDGVLTISIAKAEAAKPKEIKIGDGKSSFFKKVA